MEIASRTPNLGDTTKEQDEQRERMLDKPKSVLQKLKGPSEDFLNKVQQQNSLAKKAAKKERINIGSPKSRGSSVASNIALFNNNILQQDSNSEYSGKKPKINKN